MKLSASARLRLFHAQFAGDDRVLILIVADPDAIACAMAVKRLLWRKVSQVAIAHVNDIKRPDNLAMIGHLGLKLLHIKDIDGPRFNRVVMVDSQPSHHEHLTAFKPHIIIDHHPETEAHAPFIDIRPAYGAAASILTEYLRAAKIQPSAKLATGLLHGIKTDTDNFARNAVIEDVRAFQFLFRHANTHLIWKIEHADMRMNFIKYFKNGLTQMRVRKGRIFSHLGAVVNPDICVLLADFFMRIDTATWSIVSGVYRKQLVLIFRSDGLRKNAGKAAERSFGHLGSAGGHKTMARAEIPLTALRGVVDYRDNRRLLNWVIRSIERPAVSR